MLPAGEAEQRLPCVTRKQAKHAAVWCVLRACSGTARAGLQRQLHGMRRQAVANMTSWTGPAVHKLCPVPQACFAQARTRSPDSKCQGFRV